MADAPGFVIPNGTAVRYGKDREFSARAGDEAKLAKALGDDGVAALRTQGTILSPRQAAKQARDAAAEADAEPRETVTPRAPRKQGMSSSATE